MTTRSQTVSRWLLAGPVTLILAVLVMAAAPVWMPAGKGGVDNLVLPILLFPAFWAIAFFYSLLEDKLLRAWIILLSLAVLNSAIIVFAVTID